MNNGPSSLTSAVNCWGRVDYTKILIKNQL